MTGSGKTFVDLSKGVSATGTAPPTGLKHLTIMEKYTYVDRAVAQLQGNQKHQKQLRTVVNLPCAAVPVGCWFGSATEVYAPGVTERTTTGFSLPATNPKPSTGSRLISTFLGAGGTNLSPSRRTSSRELLWDTWLRQRLKKQNNQTNKKMCYYVVITHVRANHGRGARCISSQ